MNHKILILLFLLLLISCTPITNPSSEDITDCASLDLENVDTSGNYMFPNDDVYMGYSESFPDFFEVLKDDAIYKNKMSGVVAVGFYDYGHIEANYNKEHFFSIILGRLTTEFRTVTFMKINPNEHPEITEQYTLGSQPSLTVFVDGIPECNHQMIEIIEPSQHNDDFNLYRKFLTYFIDKKMEETAGSSLKEKYGVITLEELKESVTEQDFSLDIIIDESAQEIVKEEKLRDLEETIAHMLGIQGKFRVVHMSKDIGIEEFSKLVRDNFNYEFGDGDKLHDDHSRLTSGTDTGRFFSMGQKDYGAIITVGKSTPEYTNTKFARESTLINVIITELIHTKSQSAKLCDIDDYQDMRFSFSMTLGILDGYTGYSRDLSSTFFEMCDKKDKLEESFYETGKSSSGIMDIAIDVFK
ncbi:MAG: hypothetical protein KKF44_08295 [Nanoarchaeota archaeon]|nr:hypothetical protein [Nanoarchaeota archaeon]